MPEQPVNYRRWWPVPTAAKDSVDTEFMGADYYWGGQTGANQFYPAFKNFSIFDRFVQARKTGKYDPAWIDAWVNQFKAPTFSDEDRNLYRAHIHWTFNTRALRCRAIPKPTCPINI